MKHLNKSPIQPALIFALPVLLILAGFGSCQKRNCQDTVPTIPRFTMEKLDAKAKPFIDEAYAAVPHVVADLCSDRIGLFWLLLKDKAMGTNLARDRISSAISPRLTEPLGKVAAIYKCALNTDAAVGMTEEAALDILGRQLYASAGLAVEAVCIKTTMDSCIRILAHIAPKLASSWGLFGTLATSDGPLPIGDVIGAGLAIGGTAWCCMDLRKACKALPDELAEALRTAISSTVAQCRQEAASVL